MLGVWGQMVVLIWTWTWLSTVVNRLRVCQMKCYEMSPACTVIDVCHYSSFAVPPDWGPSAGCSESRATWWANPFIHVHFLLLPLWFSGNGWRLAMAIAWFSLVYTSVQHNLTGKMMGCDMQHVFSGWARDVWFLPDNDIMMMFVC